MGLISGSCSWVVHVPLVTKFPAAVLQSVLSPLVNFSFLANADAITLALAPESSKVRSNLYLGFPLFLTLKSTYSIGTT